MALTTEQSGGLFTVDPLPVGGSLEALAEWTNKHLLLLQQVLNRPEFGGLVLTQATNAADDQVVRIEPGLVVYAAAGIIGANEGYYVREGGVWKKITAV